MENSSFLGIKAVTTSIYPFYSVIWQNICLQHFFIKLNEVFADILLLYLQGKRKKQFKVICVYDRWDMLKILHLENMLQYTMHSVKSMQASWHYAVITYSQVQTPDDGG